MVACYAFEATSIQTFVFASNRLRETVGASELVEQLCGPLLDAALTATGTTKAVQFSRRAGGAFFAFFEDAAARDRLAALWPVLVQQYAPGLPFVAARGSGTTEAAAADSARGSLAAQRNALPVQLPLAGPLVLRNQRTGLPAVARRGFEDEAVDASTRRKLDLSEGVALAKRCCSDDTLAWPVRLSATEDGARGVVMPYDGDKQWLAVLHADGNALGALFLKLHSAWRDEPDYRSRFAAVSSAIQTATEEAVKKSVASVLEPVAHKHQGVLPARPIILGGDDLTMLIRADLAMSFTEQYLRAFEEETAAQFAPLRSRGYTVLPESLTACAGIAYADASSPFYLSYGLAAGLCERAKAHAKRFPGVPSAISFHRVTSAFVPDADDVFGRELITLAAGRRFSPTMEVYALREGAHGLPSIHSLRELNRFVDALTGASSRFRTLLNDVASADLPAAQKRYRRWRELISAEDLASFEKRFAATARGAATGDLPYVLVDDTHRTPLGDALALSVVERVS